MISINCIAFERILVLAASWCSDWCLLTWWRLLYDCHCPGLLQWQCESCFSTSYLSAAALRARLAAVARLQTGLAEPSSVISQAVAAYADLVDGGCGARCTHECFLAKLQASAISGYSTWRQMRYQQMLYTGAI